jgi:hypothetical protein
MLRSATAPARFLLGELGQGAGNAVGNFDRLVARSGLKNVPTHVEIIAELPASRRRRNQPPTGSGASVRPALAEPAFYWLPDVLWAQWLLPVSDPSGQRSTIDVNQKHQTGILPRLDDLRSAEPLDRKPHQELLDNSDRRTCGNRSSARPTALWFKGFDRPSRYL